MIDTAGTITKVAEKMINDGAKSVRAIATHPVLSGSAYDKIKNSPLTEIVVTDTIPLKQNCDKIKVSTVSKLFAEVIDKVYNFMSISSSFII